MISAIMSDPPGPCLTAGTGPRKMPRWPQKLGQLQPPYSCAPTGMRGPTCIVWANLRPLSPGLGGAAALRLRLAHRQRVRALPDPLHLHPDLERLGHLLDAGGRIILLRQFLFILLL